MNVSLSLMRRGTGLFDALVALALLSFGMLAMTGFQGRMVAQSTDTQNRQVATQFAGELLSTVLVDVANATCYTRPQSGVCANSAATTRTTDWDSRATAALPGPVTTGVVFNAATGRMTLTITWRGKEPGVTRSLETATDVRL